MEKRRVLFIILSTILLFTFMFLIIMYSYKPTESSSFSKKVSKHVEKDIESLQKVEKESYERIQAVTSEEVGYLPDSYEKIMEKYQTKEGVVKLFAASLFLDNKDLFISCFSPETIAKDLFSEKEPDKNKVVESFMKEIHRNHTLKEVGYKTKRNLLGGESENEITLVLKYGDHAVDIDIQVIAMTHSHNEDKEEHVVYAINTSAKKIMQAIREEY